MKFVLIEKSLLGGDVVSFVFEPERKISWKPGQFMHYVINHENPDDRGIERWFTISSAPFERVITITTRIFPESSSFKRALYNMQIGEHVEADGPMGKFVLKEPKANNIFIAGGIGITPFRSILAQAFYNKTKITGNLLYLSKDNFFPFKDNLDEMSPSLGLDIHYLDDIPVDFLRELSSKKSTISYISGPESMVGYFQKLLNPLGYEEEHILTDFFPGYE
ncbi:MAG: FAD-dependent oxidoreductase [bacterium]